MVKPPQSPDRHGGISLGLHEETEDTEDSLNPHCDRLLMLSTLYLTRSFKGCGQVYCSELLLV